LLSLRFGLGNIQSDLPLFIPSRNLQTGMIGTPDWATYAALRGKVTYLSDVDYKIHPGDARGLSFCKLQF